MASSITITLKSPCYFECRSDPDFSSPPRFENLRRRNRLTTKNFPISTTPFHYLSSPLIFRFPPNFQRQLSTKARRNCSNIGVAQIVAASWSNNAAPSSGSPAASPAVSAVDAASPPPLSVAPAEITGDEDLVFVVSDEGGNGNGAVQFKGSDDDVSSYSSFLKSDASKTIHAGNQFFHQKFVFSPFIFNKIRFFLLFAELIVEIIPSFDSIFHINI